MFSQGQRDYMRYIATLSSETRCWSGWCSLVNTDSSSRELCSSPNPCPIDVTLADRSRMACEICGNYPDATTMRFIHNAGCSSAKRREFYSGIELGGEG